MATRERRLDRGRVQASLVIRSTGSEIRLMWRGAGVSLRSAANAAGMSHSTLGRLERGVLPNATVVQLALACAAVGLKLVVRAYPDGDPIRDAGHTRLLQRLRGRLHPDVLWRSEVPLNIPGDLRAWDAQCVVGESPVCIEAEMRLDDLQALERRIALKRRDGGVTTVILLVANTDGNRRRLAAHREALRASFPLDTRPILAALRAGQAPKASGIVVL